MSDCYFLHSDDKVRAYPATIEIKDVVWDEW